MFNLLSRHHHDRFRATALIIIFYVLPPSAIALNLIPFQYRFPLLIAVAPILMLIKPDRQTTVADLGIAKKGAIPSILSIIPTTLVLLLPLLAFALSSSSPRIDNSSLPVLFYVFYILVSCPLQEFAYRGYLFRLMTLLSFGKWARILFGAFLYSFVHIIYLDSFTLLSTLFTGVLWNIHYDKYRNLAGVTISHIILGAATIFLGLI